MFKDFLKTGKKYLDYLMGLGFSELMINIIEIIGIVLLSSLVYIPFAVFQDLIYELIRIVMGTSEEVFRWYNILFGVATGLVAICIFVYLFNKRYSKLEKLIEKDAARAKKYKDKSEHHGEAKETVQEEMDLPKKKD